MPYQKPILIVCIAIAAMVATQLALTTYRSNYSISFNDFQHRNVTEVILSNNNLRSIERTHEHQMLRDDHVIINDRLSEIERMLKNATIVNATFLSN